MSPSFGIVAPRCPIKAHSANRDSILSKMLHCTLDASVDIRQLQLTIQIKKDRGQERIDLKEG
jgi:hypothetical protein